MLCLLSLTPSQGFPLTSQSRAPASISQNTVCECVCVCVITPLLYRRQPAALSAEGCLLFSLLSFASTSGTKLLHSLFLLSVFLSFSLPLLQSVTSINQGCKIPCLIFFFLLSLLLKSFLPVSVVFSWSF